MFRPSLERETPVVPLGLKLPVDQLPPGSYRIDFQASDASGALSAVRSVEFDRGIMAALPKFAGVPRL